MNSKRCLDVRLPAVVPIAELKGDLVDFVCGPRFERHLARFMSGSAGHGRELNEGEAAGTVDRFALQHRLPNGKTVLDLFLTSLILNQLAGETYTQVLRLAEQAALTVDPELAERRREQSQRKDARVSFFREPAGTAALSGRDLPPDEALAAMASVNARTEIYQDSDAFGDLRTDVLRAYAYLDLLKDVPAEARIACAEAQDEAAEAAEALAWAEARAAAGTATGTLCGSRAGNEAKAGNGAKNETSAPDEAGGSGGFGDPGPGADDCDDSARDDDRPGGDDGQSGGDGPDSDGPTGGGPGPGGSGPGAPGLNSGPDANRAVRTSGRRPADLVVPLATLLGLAERPGEIQGFGLVDPALPVNWPPPRPPARAPRCA